MIASHITNVFGIPQADGYYFTIGRPADNGSDTQVFVKRMDNKSFNAFQIGTEFTKCASRLNIERQVPHTLRIQVFGTLKVFYLDGVEVCRFTEDNYAPPSRIGLVARREGPAQPPGVVPGSAGYVMLVDSVIIDVF